MKPVMAVVMVLVMAVMACGVQFADQLPSPTEPPVLSSPTMRIDIMTVTPSRTSIITASDGVRLRDRPDAAGPVDSVELTIMRSGDEFRTESCRFTAGNWWAFGTYVSRETIKGWVNADFLSPNPCGGL